MAALSNMARFRQAQAAAIFQAFNNNDEDKLAELCDAALLDVALPRLYRAQYELLLCNIDDSRQLSEARYWVEDMENGLPEGKTDERVTTLRSQLDLLIESREEHDSEAEDEEAAIEEEQLSARRNKNDAIEKAMQTQGVAEADQELPDIVIESQSDPSQSMWSQQHLPESSQTAPSIEPAQPSSPSKRHRSGSPQERVTISNKKQKGEDEKSSL